MIVRTGLNSTCGIGGWVRKRHGGIDIWFVNQDINCICYRGALCNSGSGVGRGCGVGLYIADALTQFKDVTR
jgi:hypothetical protein